MRPKKDFSFIASTFTRVSAFQKVNIHRAIAEPSTDNALKVTGRKKLCLHCLFAEQVAKTAFSGDWWRDSLACDSAMGMAQESEVVPKDAQS